MNTILIELTVEDEKLRKTLFTTLAVEMESSKTERGEVTIKQSESGLELKIIAKDIVATRAITNSILRLLQTSIDVADSISLGE